MALTLIEGVVLPYIVGCFNAAKICNMECEKCKNIIKEDDYLYYCYICKLKYCYECVQSQLKNKMKKDKYIDKKHHLLFFKTKDINNFKEIEKIKLGKNKFAECDEDDLGSWSSTRCNGCSKSLNNYYRYLCLSCKFIFS